MMPQGMCQTRRRSLQDIPRMGMSEDLEVAVEEGTTQVRIGTALFGERPHLDVAVR